MQKVRAIAAGMLTWGILGIAVVLVVVVLLLRLDHIRAAQVLTGSMEPGIATGSVVVGTPLTSADISVGDVVMFRPPAPFTAPGDLPVVHRVTDITVVDGERQVRTQGDANPVEDPWVIDAEATTFYEMRMSSTVLGIVARYGAVASWPVLLGVPVVLTTAWLLRGIWRSGPMPPDGTSAAGPSRPSGRRAAQPAHGRRAARTGSGRREPARLTRA